MIPKLNDYKKQLNIDSDDAIRLGLDAIQEALVKLNNPERKLKVIHVAGTNGKGSTIAFMEALLQKNGFTTGVFSSPAIRDIHDQIRINGDEITKEELTTSFLEMKNAGLSGMLTDFELLTVAAFVTFERVQPDFVLLETGMGGRLDSTNVVHPLVSVITTIALDHTAFLGNTIEEIAREKAGIIKKGVPVVVGRVSNEALEEIRIIAGKKESQLSIYNKDFHLTYGVTEKYVGKKTFDIGERLMKGKHQGINAAVAMEALLTVGVELTASNVEIAIANTQLSHRFQEILPNVFLDGAHNPAAALALADTIRLEFPGEKVDFIIGMLKTKDIKGTLDCLIPVASSFTFLTFNHMESASGEELLRNCDFYEKSVTNIVGDTIILGKGKFGRTIVTGSLYLLNTLNYKHEDLR
ncbi:bifunctional folylpolyglutamate synthase/dihydrofolate synthase [Sporosarcina siberiensis]|uniref:Bifunctional folylpolyglutamate synthase/dihydrofolate synthase n=1 Tax=Sporosarcina siberiensis TaxID=1365606 RepID=A0ABW4SCX8_9BACL